MEKRHAVRGYFIVALVILSFGFISIFNINQHEKFSPYYQTLANVCKTKATSDCCLSSVKFMAQHNFTQATVNGCSKGYSINTDRCVDSLQWCEPN